jgi:hypothetical protein
MSLKEADRLVKEGKYAAALEAIAQAREEDPTNLYALAYEERVRALLNASTAERNRPGLVSAADSQEGDIPSTADHLDSVKDEPHSAPPAQGSERKREEMRKAAIVAKIANLLVRAQECYARREFARALDEITRARMLDPNNKVARGLEQQIRTAQEEEARKSDQERHEKEERERRQRDEQLQASLAQLQKEHVEKRLHEQQSRTAAQQEKIAQVIARSRECASSGLFAEAQRELAFVAVIDPDNADAAGIGRMIREKQEELRQKQEEEQRKKLEAIRAAIRKQIAAARASAERADFANALRTITRAYILDPMNEELQEAETSLLAAQQEATQKAEQQRRADEDAARRLHEEESRQREQAERDRVLRGSQEEDEARRRSQDEQIRGHLAKAEDHLTNDQTDSALAEVALAFMIDPFDEKIKETEQRILNAQEVIRKRDTAELLREMGDHIGDDVEASVQAHLAAAEKFRAERNFARALDEAAQAFVLDPLNNAVIRLEETIQAEAAAIETEIPESLPPPTHRAQPAGDHLQRARDYAGRNAFDEALAEIAIGLSMNPGDTELQAMEKNVWQAKNHSQSARPAAQEQANPVDRRIRIHLLAAEGFATRNEFGKALDEIAKAFAIDPLCEEIQQLDAKIRQAQHRNEHPDAPPLKLVYRKDRAANGRG